MRPILLALCFVGLIGCSTPNPVPKATASAYEQVTCGMTRDQVYALLGQPESVEPAGDLMHCRRATWSIPHGVHGVGHWTILYTGDTVGTVKTCHATIGLSH